jgi:hypothetical protein
MNIITFFSLYGTPQTGLSPTVRIRVVSTNALVVTDAVMTEVGDGFYKYDFSTYDKTIEYSIRCDGGTTLAGAERYPVAITTGYGEVLSIKEQTDKITFTTANQVDSRVRSMDNIDFGVLQKTSLNAATPASIQNIPATGSGFTSLGDTRIANLDAAISTRTKPADTQARVSLVDVTTTNSDMRGTDNAALAATALSTATWTSARAEKLDTIGGPGAIAYPFIVTQTGGAVVAGAEVWCTTDAAGTNVVEGVGITDANGLYTFHLDAGGYWFWAQHSGLNPASVYEVVT